MRPLWTAAEVTTATGGYCTRVWQATGVSIDSRTLQHGDLFVALVGPNFDGHDFVEAALTKGAAAAVVSRRVANLSDDAPQIFVADTQSALEAIGRASRARTNARIVGVTGSVGKTGTKEALRQAFERLGHTFASPGSLNNQWGVPVSLARMPRDASFGVFEMGMNHSGEIDGLSRLVRPDVAVITTVEPAHLGHFSSIEEIADAKAEIFSGMDARGAAVLNRDNPYFSRLAAAAERRGISRILGFGSHSDATVRLIDCHLHATASAVTASVMGEIVDYCLALPGYHWVMNSLAVLAAVKAAGGDIAAAAAAMGKLVAIDGRGNRHKLPLAGGNATLIDESYNASPASMRAAFAVLAAARPGLGGRRIAVLGDMLELGEASDQLHAELADPLIAAGVDQVFTVGVSMAALDAALPADRRGAHTNTATAMAGLLIDRLRPGDVVTVKGSLGSRMGLIVKELLVNTVAAVGVKG